MSDVPAIADETMPAEQDSLLDQVERVVRARGSSAGAAADIDGLANRETLIDSSRSPSWG